MNSASTCIGGLRTSCKEMSWPKNRAQSRLVAPGRPSQAGYSTASVFRSRAVMVNGVCQMTKLVQAPRCPMRSWSLKKKKMEEVTEGDECPPPGAQSPHDEGRPTYP